MGGKSNAPRFVTFWDLPLSQGKKVIPTLAHELAAHTVPIINNEEIYVQINTTGVAHRKAPGK